MPHVVRGALRRGRPGWRERHTISPSARKALEERLEHQAFHDSLAGLPNRALFMDRLVHTLARMERHEKPFTVLFVHLDDFKSVNDSFGHEVGDRLLAAVATRQDSALRAL